MGKSRVVITLTAVLLTSSVWAQESGPATKNDVQWAAEKAERADSQARLDELMSTLTEEMAAIRKTKKRTERQALMVKHREHMAEAMSLMRGMGGTHMRELMTEHMESGMGAGMQSDRPRHRHKSSGIRSYRPRGEQSDAQRLTDLENRLDMMQVMMESMMDTHSK